MLIWPCRARFTGVDGNWLAARSVRNPMLMILNLQSQSFFDGLHHCGAYLGPKWNWPTPYNSGILYSAYELQHLGAILKVVDGLGWVEHRSSQRICRVARSVDRDLGKGGDS